MAKHMYQRKPSMGFGEGMMWIAGVLFCLVLITTSMMGGMYARYTTSSLGSDGARVIRFGNIRITESGDFIDGTKEMPITPGVAIKKDAKVEFDGSEAATYVFLKVTHTGAWTGSGGVYSNSGKLTWQIADGWEKLENNVYYIVLEPNKTLSADIIKGGTIQVAADIKNSEIDALKGTISFQASAVQWGGFADAGAAWASLQSKEVP